MLVAGVRAGERRAEASQQQQAQQQAQSQAYQQGQQAAQAQQAPAPAPPKDTTAELMKLADLHKAGALTDQEFEAAKKKLLT